MGDLFLGLMDLGSSSLQSFETVFRKVKQNQRPRFSAPLACISSSTLTSQHECLSSLVSVMLVSFQLFYCSFQVSFGVSPAIHCPPLNRGYSPKYQSWPIFCSWCCVYPMKLLIGSHPHSVFPKSISLLWTHSEISEHI